MNTTLPHSPPPSTIAPLPLFAVALAIATIELASFAYLLAASEDFIVARRERRLPLYTLDTLITWQGQSLGQLYGWSRPDPMGAWSIGPAAALAVRIRDRAPGDLELRVLADGVIDPKRVPRRKVAVSVNGKPLTQWLFETSGPVKQSIRIPDALIASDGIVRVEFRVDEYRSPRMLGVSADTRAIGFRLIEWKLSLK